MEHLSRHRDLGHLEHDVAAVAHHLGADLDQLLLQSCQGLRLRGFGDRERPHEIAKVAGPRVEPKADGVGSERTA